MNARTLAALCLILSAAPLKADDAAAPATEADKTLYAYGYYVGQTIASVGFDEGELKTVLSGLVDAAHDKKSPLDISDYKPQIGEVLRKHLKARAEKTKTAGKAFAAKFAKEKGVKPLPKGGWIQTVQAGDGAQPASDDTVKVNYRGTLIDGTEFDSSYKRHEPSTFEVDRVIPGWTEALQLMKPGAKYKLFIPPQLAYDMRSPPPIPPGSMLIFEVELISVKAPSPAASPTPQASPPPKP
jgi:FKBP-type peptidyl-prolyl cis-trans isomerase FkpA